MKSTVICYKTINPVYYNKGTEWEKSCDHFLAYYTYKTVEEAKKEVAEINKNHPNKDTCGNPIDWTKVKEFFVSEQEEMY